MKTAMMTTEQGRASRTTTIDVQELATHDQLLLWTRNSLYRFLVTDGAARRGRLLRGRLAVSPEEVTLVGATEQGGDAEETVLQVGRRAVFLVADGADERKLLTSPLTGLRYVSAADRFHSETWDDEAGLAPLPFGRKQPGDTADSRLLLSW